MSYNTVTPSTIDLDCIRDKLHKRFSSSKPRTYNTLALDEPEDFINEVIKYDDIRTIGDDGIVTDTITFYTAHKGHDPVVDQVCDALIEENPWYLLAARISIPNHQETLDKFCQKLTEKSMAHYLHFALFKSKHYYYLFTTLKSAKVDTDDTSLLYGGM